MKTIGFEEAASGTSSPAAMLRFAMRRWRKQMTHLFDPYRPELHYMRGPGPKCREKQAHTGVALR